MFFVLSLMALTLGLAPRNRKLLRNVASYIFVAVTCLILIAVGVAGQGGIEFGSDQLIAVLLAEPYFTSVSGSLYREHSGGRPIYGLPRDLLSSVIHFIPSAIIFGKIAFMCEIKFASNVQSRFWTKALLVSPYSNCGIFYPTFFASVGCCYGFLCKKARQSVFYRATYFSALPVLTFFFFRGEFSTVTKVRLFNGLAVPLLIALLPVWLFPRQTGETKDRYFRSVSDNPAPGMQGISEHRS